jgi:hypothetical protein
MKITSWQKKRKEKKGACNFYRGFCEKKSPKFATFLQILLLLSSPYLDYGSLQDTNT